MTSTPKRIPIPRNGVDYRGKIVLAPMVRSGELPSRLLALKYGADLVWGPETVDRSMIGTKRVVNEKLNTVDFTRPSSNGGRGPTEDQADSLIFRIHPELESRRLIFQIGTSNPERAVEAAKLVAADVAGIDVNAGCPKPFSTSGGMGAALLQTPELLCEILDKLVKEVASEFEIGISVKIRLLETPEKTETLVRMLCKTGITGLTIHCRTTPMRPRERAIREQLKMIADVCREHGVACIMNGDVASREQAVALLPEFGVDGAMIATAAEANSSVFRTQEEGGLAPWREVVEEYLKYTMLVENKFGNTKFLIAHLVPGKDPLYRQAVQQRSYVQICELFGFTELIEQAIKTDEACGLTEDIINNTRGARKQKQREAQKAKQIKQQQNQKRKRSVSPMEQSKRISKAESQKAGTETQVPGVTVAI